MTPKSVKPYQFDAVVEKCFVLAFCSRPSFFARFEHGIEPKALASVNAQELVELALAHKRRTAAGPSDVSLLLQHVIQQVTSGTQKHAYLIELRDYVKELYALDDTGSVPSEDDLITAVTPVIRREALNQLYKLQLLPLLTAHAPDLGKAIGALQRVQQLGTLATTLSVNLENGADVMVEQRHLDYLPTGVSELDYHVRGLARGCLGFVGGGTGSGKSIWLTHQTVEAALRGKFVAYVTLELGVPLVVARINANMTQLPISGILDDDDILQCCEARRRYLCAQGAVMPEVAEFTPGGAKVSDLEDWLDELEQRSGRKVDLLVVDYADKLGHSKGTMYEGMGEVYEGLRVLMKNRRGWCWTAAQARRGSGKKILDQDDISDSQHKVRAADLVITLNPDIEERTMQFFVAKNRTGQGQQLIGPLETCFAEGRMAPLSNERLVFP